MKGEDTLQIRDAMSGRRLRILNTVLNPFWGSATTMIAALRAGRSSIGVEIDPEYCRMTTRYLKAENADLFFHSEFIFEKAAPDRPYLVEEDPELYEVRPAKKRLK